MKSEKGRDMTQSYDKSPYTDRKIQKAKEKKKIFQQVFRFFFCAPFFFLEKTIVTALC